MKTYKRTQDINNDYDTVDRKYKDFMEWFEKSYPERKIYPVQKEFIRSLLENRKQRFARQIGQGTMIEFMKKYHKYLLRSDEK